MSPPLRQISDTAPSISGGAVGLITSIQMLICDKIFVSANGPLLLHLLPLFIVERSDASGQRLRVQKEAGGVGGGGGCQAAPRGGALAYAHSGNAFDNSCRKKDRNVRSISRKWLDLRQRQGEVGGGGSGGGVKPVAAGHRRTDIEIDQ